MELRVGGQTYRVVATDDDQHVQRLAELVDRKYVEIVPSRGVTPQQAIFLTAMALAEEVEEQRARAARLEVERDRSTRLAERAKDAVARLLKKVESALTPGSAAPTTSQESSPKATPFAEAPSQDPSDAHQSGPNDAQQSPPREARQSPPVHDVRRSPPRETRQSPAREAGKSSPHGGAPVEEVARRPAIVPARRAPAAPEQQDESADLLADLQRELQKTPREPAPRDVQQSLPRGGLRLLRQPASLWSGATPAKPGSSDDETP